MAAECAFLIAVLCFAWSVVGSFALHSDFAGIKSRAEDGTSTLIDSALALVICGPVIWVAIVLGELTGDK